jgi:hypothetical protein
MLPWSQAIPEVVAYYEALGGPVAPANGPAEPASGAADPATA